MFYRLISRLLSVAMIGVSVMPQPVYATQQLSVAGLSEAELMERYPTATIIHVTPEAYPALEKKLRLHGYRQSVHASLQRAEEDEAADQPTAETRQTMAVSADECAGSGVDSAGEESMRVMVDFTEDMMKSGNQSSSDEAALVFIIIGTVVLVVWVLYVFKYLYDVSAGFRPCGRWKELTLVSSTTASGGNQHARFDGLRLSAGFRDGLADVGISFELGQADILLREVATLELKGRYWMLGPMLRWRLSAGRNPSYFQMNFSAGTTENSDVGLLAKATLGLLFGIGESMQLGLSWGTMNINLDEDQGIISDRSQYYYLYGVNFGFRF